MKCDVTYVRLLWMKENKTNSSKTKIPRKTMPARKNTPRFTMPPVESAKTLDNFNSLPSILSNTSTPIKAPSQRVDQKKHSKFEKEKKPIIQLESHPKPSFTFPKQVLQIETQVSTKNDSHFIHQTERSSTLPMRSPANPTKIHKKTVSRATIILLILSIAMLIFILIISFLILFS